MAYNEIDLGTANAGNGSGAREAGGFINNNFKELFSRSFKLNNWIVTRWTYDPNNLNFTTVLSEDVLEGWYDENDKDRWVKFKVLNASGINLPADVDSDKVLLLLDVLKT